jgi:AcrR family transcriptional regulator
MTDLTLRERKQRRAREQIVDAAYALFAERGFAGVSVSDIAERAEVGRTTFFRYFGDKQEVLFAGEEPLIEAFASAPVDVPAPADLGEALDQLWDLTRHIGDLVLGDPSRYAQQEQLISGNADLSDRAGRKFDRIAAALEDLLRRRGTEPELAVLAAQVAIGSFRAAQRVAGPEYAAVMPAMQRMVDRLQGR